MFLDRLKRFKSLLHDVTHCSYISIDLMYAGTADNDPFYARVTRDFYREATRRHPKFPLVRRLEYGFAVCHLGDDYDAYLNQIDASARRNFKKSCRLGYTFGRIDYNDYLDEITDILRSTDVRQGRPMPAKFFDERANPTKNPPSRSRLHDYPCFGIKRDGKIWAFATCLVAGELCSIQTIFGHSQHQPDGIVPMLIISIVNEIFENYPTVKYYTYGSYYGASDTMKRFKKKFHFLPHRVAWKLGD
jgi:hypothetical protein